MKLYSFQNNYFGHHHHQHHFSHWYRFVVSIAPTQSEVAVFCYRCVNQPSYLSSYPPPTHKFSGVIKFTCDRCSTANYGVWKCRVIIIILVCCCEKRWTEILPNRWRETDSAQQQPISKLCAHMFIDLSIRENCWGKEEEFRRQQWLFNFNSSFSW